MPRSCYCSCSFCQFKSKSNQNLFAEKTSNIVIVIVIWLEHSTVVIGVFKFKF